MERKFYSSLTLHSLNNYHLPMHNGEIKEIEPCIKKERSSKLEPLSSSIEL